MKRHPGLIELSHDHHAALFVALGLRRADEGSAAEARSAFLDYWDTHGRAHFRQEEEILFPSFAAYGDAHHPLLARALGDHVAIRRLARQVADETPDVAVLVELGGAIEQHVRLEERRLFPLIEDAMPDEALREVARAIAQTGPVS